MNCTIRVYNQNSNSRYMGTYNDNIKLIKKLKYKETYNQLKKWNVKFHKLL